MQIIVKNKSQSSPANRGRILSYHERRSLEEKRDHLDKVLQNGEIRQGVNWDVKDAQEVERKRNSIDRILKTQGSVDLSRSERRQLENEEYKIRQSLQKGWDGVDGIPRWREYNVHPKEGMDFINMRDTIVRWEQSPLRRRLVNRWKNVQRMLHPDDPSASNVMKLFPK